MGSRLVRVINLLYGIYRVIPTVGQLPVPVTVREPMKDLAPKPLFEFVGNSSVVTPAVGGLRVRVGPFERIGYPVGDTMSFASSNGTDENKTDSSMSYRSANWSSSSTSVGRFKLFPTHRVSVTCIGYCDVERAIAILRGWWAWNEPEPEPANRDALRPLAPINFLFSYPGLQV